METAYRLFADDGWRILETGLSVLGAPRTGEKALGGLRRAMHRMLAEAGTGVRDPAGELEKIRLHLVTSVPALRATMLQRAFDTQEELATALRQAYPDELDAAALVGAVFAAGQTAVRIGRPLDLALRRAIDVATENR